MLFLFSYLKWFDIDNVSIAGISAGAQSKDFNSSGANHFIQTCSLEFVPSLSISLQ